MRPRDSPRIGHQLLVDGGRDELGYIGVAELALGLTLELRLGQLDADNNRQSLAHVVAGELLVAVLENGILASVVVENAGQSGLEAGLVRAAVNGADVICKREHGLVVAVCVLHGYLRAPVAVHGGEVDGSFVQGGLPAAHGEIIYEA